MKGLLITYALTYGGSVVALFRPVVGLYIYVLFAIIKPEALWSYSVPAGGNLSRIVAIALLIGWAGQGFGDWNLGKARGIVLSLVGFLAWAMLSGCFAPDAERSWYFIESIAKIVIPFCVGMTLLKTESQVRTLAWIIALAHGYLAFEFNLTWVRDGVNYIMQYGFANMEEGSIAIGMVAASGVAFFLGLSETSWWRKGLAFFSAANTLHVVLLSFNRGGMLALIFSAIVAVCVLPRRPIYYAILAAAVLLVVYEAGPDVRRRFLTAFASEETRDASAQSRLVLWGNCIELMTRHPVLGVGPYHFPLHAESFGWPKLKEAHTLWLQIGAELGIPGLGFLLAFYGLCVWRLLPYALNWGGRHHPWDAGMARLVVTSISGFAFASQFISLWAAETPYYVALIGAATLKVISIRESARCSALVGPSFTPTWEYNAACSPRC